MPLERMAGRELDVTPLVVSLRSVTNSYKHLFFRAILKKINYSESGYIEFSQLFSGMLEEAWWPAFHYRLSLGKSDKVVEILTHSIDNIDDLRVRPDMVPNLIAEIPFDLKAQRSRGLLRYVPQRLIAPWFGEDVKGAEDRLVPALSNEKFLELKPLYKIEDKGINVHPEWYQFITEWMEVFLGWSDANWLTYLESRNPHASALLSKLRPSFDRGPLTPQRRIWAEACKIVPVQCIYTGRPVDPAIFALDHVLPHSFVGHDRFWNLSPTDPGLNRDKRDALPNVVFLPKLAEQHAMLHSVSKKLPSGAQRDLRRYTDEYCIDLGIQEDDLCRADRLAAKYVENFDLMRGIAGRMGFPVDWKPALG